MKLSIVAGATSQSLNIFVLDSSSSVGAGLTGLAYNTSSLIAYYTFAGANATATAITLATLAAVSSAWSSGGFKEIDSTHMPGVYRLDLPNAVLAASKGRSVVVVLSGATNMAPVLLEIELTGIDNQDAVHGGMSALPNTACTTNASLLTSGTGTDQVSVSSGKVLLQATQTGVTIPTVTTVTNQLTAAQIATGVWQDTTSGDFTVSGSVGKSLFTGGVVPGGSGGLFIAGTNAATTVTTSFTTTFTGSLTGSVGSVTGAVGSVTGNVGGNVVGSVGSVTGAVGSVTGNVGGNVTGSVGSVSAAVTLSASDSPVARANTAQAGASTTITLDSGASGTTNAYTGCLVKITSGTGASAGQCRTITAYNGSTKVATVDYAWEVNPDNTSVFAVLYADSPALNSSLAVTASQAFPTNFSALSIDSSGRVDLGKVLGTASAGAPGYVGIDWGHVNAPTTTVGLTNTTISTSQAVASVSGAVGSVTGNVGGNVVGSVASVSGAVGSVTGDVGGNLVGSVASIATGGISRASFTADTGLQPVRSGTAQTGSTSTTIKLDSGASAIDDYYDNCRVYITGGTGAGQIAAIRSYVGATNVATVTPGWTTTPDNTSTFAVLPAVSAWDEVTADHLASGTTGNSLNAAGAAGDPWSTDLPGAYGAGTAGHIIGNALPDHAAGANGGLPILSSSGTTLAYTVTTVTTVTNQLTAAGIATGVWQDATAGDFTVSGSIGKSLFTGGAVPGAAGGLFIAGTNAATTIAGLTTGALSCTTITASGAVAFQSTFAVTTSTSLAAFSCTTLTASGAVAFQSTFATTGTTTLNAVTVTNATTLSGAVSLGSTLAITGTTTFTGAVAMSAGLAANITGNLTGTVSTVTTVTNQLTAAAIATGVWQDTTSGDFTVSGSIGKSLVTGPPSWYTAPDNTDIATLIVQVGALFTTRIPGVVQPQTGDSYALIGAAGAGLTALVAASSLPSHFSSMAIDANGRVQIQSGVTVDTAMSYFQFLLVQAGDPLSPATGLTVTAQRVIDNGSLAACANPVVEIGNGLYRINMAASDRNGGVVTFLFTAPGAVPRYITLNTTP